MRVSPCYKKAENFHIIISCDIMPIVLIILFLKMKRTNTDDSLKDGLIGEQQWPNGGNSRLKGFLWTIPISRDSAICNQLRHMIGSTIKNCLESWDLLLIVLENIRVFHDFFP